MPKNNTKVKKWPPEPNILNENYEPYRISFEELNDRLSSMKNCYEQAEQFKLKFLFEAFEAIMDFLDNRMDDESANYGDYDKFSWIYTGLLEELQSKSDKSNERFLIGTLIAEIVNRGSSKKPAFEAVAEWLTISETKCRSAFHELQRLKEIYPEDIRHTFWESTLIKMIDGNKKNFPEHNRATSEAFIKLRQDLSRYKIAKNRAEAKALALMELALSSKEQE